MNEEIQQRLFKYLDHIESLVGKGEDLVGSELPAFAQEVINWEFWTSTINVFAVGIPLLVVYFIWFLFARGLYKYFQRLHKEGFNADEFMGGVMASIFLVVSLIPSFIPLSYVVNSSKQAVKCVIAPRLVLVEKVSELMKDKK